jgi:glycosyltransferase involved in cell wall biosynthesis
MPRSRGEAMMCGTPIITTSGLDTDLYFKNGYNCIIADNYSEMIMGVKNLIRNKTLMNDITDAGIETAIKHFNIKNYINKWSEVFKIT